MTAHLTRDAGGPPPPSRNEVLLREAVDRLRGELDAARDLLADKDDLLVCYRLGKHPSEALLRRLDQHRAAYDKAMGGS